MFRNTAKYYDEIYASMKKDYAGEAAKANKFIQKHKKTNGRKLLDVACGTGTHANYLNQYYDVEGIDLDTKMIAVAKSKYSSIKFQYGDMVNFSMSRKFDVITCLFSSIGYVKTKTRLQKAVKNMAGHLRAGGILLIEPWFSQDQWTVGRMSLASVDRDDLKLTRISRSSRSRGVSIIEFQYLIGTSRKITHVTERHEMGLFSKKDYLDAFHSAGLKTVHDPRGLDGRGLYIGIKP
jgi:SAM-dependent methyltransferase